MKATELMIGDWVHCDYRDSSIEDVRESYDCRVNSLDDDYNVNGNSEECYSPIPLTEEILKANGWKYYRINDIWTEDAYKYVNDKIRSEYLDDMCLLTIKGKVLPCNIKFVHELQHALRLCGLNDLADNFKIE